MRMRMRGEQHHFCLNWTSSCILFTVLLNSILIGASTLVPASEVQLLRGGGESDDQIKLGKSNVWNRGGKPLRGEPLREEPEETTFGLHLLGSTRLKSSNRLKSSTRSKHLLGSTSTRSKRVKRGLTDKDRRYYIILGSCLVGGFFLCCYVPCALIRLREWWGAGYVPQEVPLGPPQRGPTWTTREGASPPSHATAPLLMPDHSGPELPPSYATAVLEDEKVAELDKRLDQQKEVIDAQNARLVEQEAKLVEMSRRLVENEQITAVADST